MSVMWLAFVREKDWMYGLSGMGSRGSVSVTVEGTVSSIRAKMSVHMDWKVLVSEARAFMVTFPSAAKIRLSELRVSL